MREMKASLPEDLDSVQIHGRHRSLSRQAVAHYISQRDEKGNERKTITDWSEDMLTPKQEKFVQGIIQGMSQADAYRSAYSVKKMSDKTIYEAASRLCADGKVKARLRELRDRMTKETIMSAQKRLEWLTQVITSDKESTTDKLKAADIMNKMQGEYVQKVRAEVTNAVSINIELSDD